MRIRSILVLAFVAGLVGISSLQVNLQGNPGGTDSVFVSTWRSGTRSTIYRLEPRIKGLMPIAGHFDHLVLGTCGPDGFLYFAERGKQRIVKVSQDGRTRQVIYQRLGDNPWEAPEGPSFDDQGDLYFTTTDEGGAWWLKEADPANEAVQVVKPFGVPGRQIAGAGTAFLRSPPYRGHLIIANYENDQVYRINPSDFCSSNTQRDCGKGEVFFQLDDVYGLAVNEEGDIFASTCCNSVDRVHQFSSRGAYVGEVASVANGIAGIAVDSEGNLWIASANALVKISPAGEREFMSSIPSFGAGIAICKSV